MTKIINMYAGPSSGKSTLSHQLMGYMKDKRLNVEFAAEKAKDLVWGDDLENLDNQLYVFSEQNKRIYRLLGKVDYVITDSPLLLSAVYLPNSQKKFSGDDRDHWLLTFEDFIVETFHQYDNINFFVERGNRTYIQAGRTQTYEQAVMKDIEIKDFLDKEAIRYDSVNNLEDIKYHLGV